MSQREFLTTLAREAGEILRQRFHSGSSYSEKGRWDLVAEVDLEIEGLIVSRLAAAYPNDSVFSEEMGDDGKAAHRRWIVDPLDGTANFIFGVPHFAVSIALQEGDEVTAGIVLNPMTAEVYFSEGRDASCRSGERMRCSDREELDGCLASVGVSLIPANLRRILDEWQPLFERQRKGLALLSPALNICNVACGRTDVFVDFGSEMAGHAAAALILANAGGTVSNYDFSAWDHRSRGIIASNGKLHRSLEEIAGQRRTQ